MTTPTAGAAAPATPANRLRWTVARVRSVQPETTVASRLVLHVPGWTRHVPGQHLDVRLTAPDGYRAQRSCSIASGPERPDVELVVETLPDGEVSPYLTEQLRDGDELEVRGPVGGWFVWHTSLGGPLQLVAGGSGVVPFPAMLEHRAAAWRRSSWSCWPTARRSPSSALLVAGLAALVVSLAALQVPLYAGSLAVLVLVHGLSQSSARGALGAAASASAVVRGPAFGALFVVRCLAAGVTSLAVGLASRVAGLALAAVTFAVTACATAALALLVTARSSRVPDVPCGPIIVPCP